jgi:hypothetical protein
MENCIMSAGRERGDESARREQEVFPGQQQAIAIESDAGVNEGDKRPQEKGQTSSTIKKA